MIIDCFTFFNEEEILKIRLHELSNVVDKFLIVESSTTFSGKNKQCYFYQIGDWIEPFMNQIDYLFVEMPDQEMTVWDREYFQRNIISQYVSEFNTSDVMAIISDVDEIPRPSIIPNLYPLCQLDVVQYMWNFNWQVPQHCNQGARPVCATSDQLKRFSAQELRAADLAKIPNAGWHFSYFTDFRTKIESFAHTEYNLVEYKKREHIQYCRKYGIDPFDRFPLKWSEIDGSYPLYVQQNKHLYENER